MRRKFDKTIYPNSRISKLPKQLRSMALFFRFILQRKQRYHYEYDGVASAHNFSFMSDERFLKSLNYANSISGFDYRIYLRLHQAIWCAQVARELSPSASFVELGTGKGYVMAGVLKYLEGDKPKYTNKVFLFDTFTPYATNFLGKQDPSFGTNIYYADSLENTMRAFSSFSGVSFVQGELPGTLETVNVGDISFLHIDLNSPVIETNCLRALWDKLLPGALILIDDYAYQGFDKTYEMMNVLAQELGRMILTTASGQGLMIK